MDIKEIILTDEGLSAIDNGVWVGDLSGAPGLELLVTGVRAKEAQKTLEQKQAHLRLKNRGKPLTEEQLARAMRETLAEKVLKGWRGLTSNGDAVNYDQDLAAQWILSRNGEKFAGLVLQAAQRVDDQANDFAEEIVKN